MRYLVKAKLKSGKKRPLIRAIDEGTLGRGSIAGDEYLHNMREARVDNSGSAIWVETCFCDCDCTKRLAKRLRRAGNSFLEQLRGHESCPFD